MDLVLCIHLICVFLLWQSEALSRIRCREQRVRCRGSSQTHHGHERGRLHVLPDGGGRGCLQETVLSLHQERCHTRHGKITVISHRFLYGQWLDVLIWIYILKNSWVDPSAKSERNCFKLWEMPTFDASFLFPRWRKCTKKHMPTSGQTLYTKRNPKKTSRRRGEFGITDFPI